MSTTILPSIRALCSPDDALLAREGGAAMIRTQVAVVRALLDDVDRLVPSVGEQRAMMLQLSDEIMELARGLVDAARQGDQFLARFASGT